MCSPNVEASLFPAENDGNKVTQLMAAIQFGNVKKLKAYLSIIDDSPSLQDELKKKDKKNSFNVCS